MNSFLVSPADVTGDRLALAGEEAHHCARVLRLREGEEVLAIDGLATAYRVRLRKVDPARVEGEILETLPRHNEPAVEVWLALGILKQTAKFDIVVEKGTELGAAGFIPLRTGHGERESVKLDRWRKIAESAAKQCLRCRVPLIESPCAIAEAIALRTFDRVVLAHERAPRERTLQSAISGSSHILALVGPEGGFTPDEVAEAERAGASIVSLGARRLRSETAAIVALAALVRD